MGNDDSVSFDPQRNSRNLPNLARKVGNNARLGDWGINLEVEGI